MQNLANVPRSGKSVHWLRHNFLSSDEEAALAERYSHGDIAARNALVTAHFPLVNKYVARYRRNGVERDDLVSEGKIGLRKP